MMAGARICPRCSARVDERRAGASPCCLSCGAPLATRASTFPGKKPGGGGGSALPWILGGVGLLVLLGLGGVLALVAVANSDALDPASPAASATVPAGPRLESTSSPGDGRDAAPPLATAARTPAAPRPPTPRTPSPPATFVVRPTATPPPTVVPRPPPPPTAPPDPGPVALGPFPRERAQAEVDRVARGLATCKRAGGPFGAGSIRVDFEPDGRVGTLSRPPFASTPVGSCISARFLALRIGKFVGSTQHIEKTFIIQE